MWRFSSEPDGHYTTACLITCCDVAFFWKAIIATQWYVSTGFYDVALPWKTLINIQRKLYKCVSRYGVIYSRGDDRHASIDIDCMLLAGVFLSGRQWLVHNRMFWLHVTMPRLFWKAIFDAQPHLYNCYCVLRCGDSSEGEVRYTTILFLLRFTGFCLFWKASFPVGLCGKHVHMNMEIEK